MGVLGTIYKHNSRWLPKEATFVFMYMIFCDPDYANGGIFFFRNRLYELNLTDEDLSVSRVSLT